MKSRPEAKGASPKPKRTVKLIPIRDGLRWRSKRTARPNGHVKMRRVQKSYRYDDSRVLKVLDIAEGRKLTPREKAIVEALYFHVMLNFAQTSSMQLGINDGGRPIAWVGIENAEVEFDLEDVLSDLANDALQGGGAAGDRTKLIAFRALATRLVATMDAWILELDETPKAPASQS